MELNEATHTLKPPAWLDAFGYPSTPVAVTLLPRPVSWRMTRSLLSLLVGWGMIPVVALIPPHAPWAILAFFGGAFFAQRFARERVTLLDMAGPCPRCQKPLQTRRPAMFREPYSIDCGHCGQGLLLRVEGAQPT